MTCLTKRLREICVTIAQAALSLADLIDPDNPHYTTDWDYPLPDCDTEYEVWEPTINGHPR